MSTIPEVPVQLLSELFTPFGVEVTITDRGVHLARGTDSYRLKPTEDGFARGSALTVACRIFEIDPFQLIYS